MAAVYLLTAWLFAAPTPAKNVRSPTPPMGWNSYNAYNCYPSEAIMKSNAKGLVDLGLAQLGYTSVTTDCGWVARDRDAQGRLQWNQTLFPSGGPALGEYIHGLGLDFGVYSGAGYLQCGSTDLPASLGYEEIDAKSFADWKADSLKYDNCYPTGKTTMVEYTGTISESPARFQKMATVLEATSRDIQYFVCQWGVGYDVGSWASAIGNTWRISNDIYNAWRSIWRIANQAVPFYKYTKPGAFPDLDMLIVGLNVLSAEEERFHFGMWAINKSPLIIGARLDATSVSQTSLNIMKNKEVIAINQDPLGKQAQLIRRYTEEEWDIWSGELSGGRRVVGLANWKNTAQKVQLDLRAVGVASAQARDVWAAQDLGVISGTREFSLAGHELKLLVFTNIASSAPLKSTGYYAAASATLGGSAAVVNCPTGDCLPTGRKVGNIGSGATVQFKSVPATTAGRKVLGVDFINYELAMQTAWDWGSNTRNMTIAVNGGKAKRWAFPISGGDWSETGRLTIEVDGFVSGQNQITFASFGTPWAPDLVGVEVYDIN